MNSFLSLALAYARKLDSVKMDKAGLTVGKLNKIFRVYLERYYSSMGEAFKIDRFRDNHGKTISQALRTAMQTLIYKQSL